MEEISCSKCQYAAKLVSEDESYYICFPKNQRSTDVGEYGSPDWCPIKEQKEAIGE